MPKLTGIFSQFKELETLSADDLNHWLKLKENPYYLENYIANRILYPQAIPTTQRDLEIDTAILREFIRRDPQLVYNPKQKKIILTDELVGRFPPISKLIVAILDVIELDGITVILLTYPNQTSEIVGSIISTVPEREGSFDVDVDGQRLSLKDGTVTVVPNHDIPVIVKIGLNPSVSMAGGSLGIVVDLRKAKN